MRKRARVVTEVRHQVLRPAASPRVFVTYQLELVACGKRTCRTCGATSPKHGPYWYAYFGERGRHRSRYVGKEFRELTHAELARE